MYKYLYTYGNRGVKAAVDTILVNGEAANVLFNDIHGDPGAICVRLCQV